MTSGLVLNFPFCSSSEDRSLSNYTFKNHLRLRLTNPSSLQLQPPRVSPQAKASSVAMEADKTATASDSSPPIKLLFVEMGVGYDQHGCVLHALWLSFPHSDIFFFWLTPIWEIFEFNKLIVVFLWRKRGSKMNLCATGKTLRLRLCGRAGMRSLPTRFLPSVEVFLLGFSECEYFHGCGVGLDRFVLLVRCWELGFSDSAGWGITI